MRKKNITTAKTLLFFTFQWILLMSIILLAGGDDSYANDISVPCKASSAADMPPVPNEPEEYCYKTSGEIGTGSSRDAHTKTRSATVPASVIIDGPQAPRNLRIVEATPEQKKYTLTISANGEGTTEPSPGPHSFVEGTSVSVKAIAADGYTFTGWSGAASGMENPIRLSMNANLSLSANFSRDNVLPDKCPRNCDDAVPRPATVLDDGGHGNVTMYSTEASSGGACNYGSTNITHYAAMHSSIEPGDGMGAWQAGRACGHCVEVVVVTSQGPRRLVVRIVDECPDANCGIDLGGLAPGELMIDGFGRYDGQWRYVSCDGHPGVSDGPPSLAVFNGSNPWWSRVQVRNGTTAVQAISWKATDGSSGTFTYAQDLENGYEVPVEDVLQSKASSFLITVTYVDETTATVTVSPAELAAPDSSYPLD